MASGCGGKQAMDDQPWRLWETEQARKHDARQSVSKLVRLGNSAYARTLRSTLKPYEWNRDGSAPFDFTALSSNLVQGRVPRSREDLSELQAIGVSAVVTLCEAWELRPPRTTLGPTDFRDHGMDLLFAPTPDFSCPELEDLEKAMEFIESRVANDRKVYVHCNGGKSRSTAVSCCFLMKEKNWTPSQAFDFVKRTRTEVGVTLGPWFSSFWSGLQTFHRRHVDPRGNVSLAGRGRRSVAAFFESGSASRAGSGMAAEDPSDTATSPQPGRHSIAAFFESGSASRAGSGMVVSPLDPADTPTTPNLARP